ncbi:MAG: DUF4923 family protein [Alistipes sp.]|nr:DUF4923 family protein [Alistipes sp.]
MRRFVVVMLFAVVGLVASTTDASAQFDLSRALNSLLGAKDKVKEKEAVEPAKTPYDTLAEQAVSPSKLTGVWLYHSATVEYLGANPLADVALAQLEGYAQAELRGAGVLPGFFGLTLRRNGVAYLSHEDDIYEGRYKYNSSDASVTISTTVNDMTLSLGGYVKQSGTRMELLLDAADAMTLFKELFPEYKTNSMVISADAAIKSFGDVFISIRFTR